MPYYIRMTNLLLKEDYETKKSKTLTNGTTTAPMLRNALIQLASSAVISWSISQLCWQSVIFGKAGEDQPRAVPVPNAPILADHSV